jgi:hypothetical protein
MKVIFLDIDGVLNCNDTYTNAEFREYPYNHFDDKLVGNLNKITTKTGASIVVSSSWRINRTFDELREILVKAGVSGKIIAQTERLYFGNSSMSVPRGCEIQLWLQTNKGLLGDLLNWRDYVILDDDSDMLYWHRANFFQTDASGGGLTDNLTYRIINFLGVKNK